MHVTYIFIYKYVRIHLHVELDHSMRIVRSYPLSDALADDA